MQRARPPMLGFTHQVSSLTEFDRALGRPSHAEKVPPVCALLDRRIVAVRTEARVRLERRHTTRWRIVTHSDHINAITCPLQRERPFSVVESRIALSHCVILASPRRYGSGAKVSRVVLFLDDEVTAARLVSSRFVPPRFI